MTHSPEHLARLETAVATLYYEEARQRARQLDAILEPLSLFWGHEGGDPYLEWSGSPEDSYVIRLHSL
jgi:hypothetical protein